METIHRDCICCGNNLGKVIPLGKYSVAGVGVIETKIKICGACGCLIQDPAPAPEVMAHYYKTLSNYTNVSRDGRPDVTAVAATQRQLALVHEFLKPGRAYEVGCATGYMLSELKRFGWAVTGCDPSPSAARIAVELWGIQIQIGKFDDLFHNSESVDLVLMLHVLEHVYDPVDILRKAANLLCKRGYLLVEVPCLIRPEMWGNGYFTFEHINMFSESTLIRCLSQAGFQALAVRVDGDSAPYPVITVLAEKTDKVVPSPVVQDSPTEIEEMVNTYLRTENSEWLRLNNILENELLGVDDVLLWGGGIHTSQLLLNTTALKRVNIKFVIDSDPQKRGLNIDGLEIRSYCTINFDVESPAIVISSKAHEDEIYSFLKNELKVKSKIIRLYK